MFYVICPRPLSNELQSQTRIHSSSPKPIPLAASRSFRISYQDHVYLRGGRHFSFAVRPLPSSSLLLPSFLLPLRLSNSYFWMSSVFFFSHSQEPDLTPAPHWQQWSAGGGLSVMGAPRRWPLAGDTSRTPWEVGGNRHVHASSQTWVRQYSLTLPDRQFFS